MSVVGTPSAPPAAVPVPPEHRVTLGPADFGFSRYSLRVWHGMTLGAFLRMMRGNTHLVSRNRLGLLCSVAVLSLGNSALRLLDDAVHARRIAAVKIDPDPLFILGHWRSGTTWLNQLLAADDRLASPTAMQCFCPQTFLSARLMLRAILPLLLPRARPMDDVGLAADTAEEDELAILLSGAPTPYRWLAFPCDVVQGVEIAPEKMTPEAAAFWRKSWIGFLKKLQFLNPGRRLLLKSPLHTLRIPEILRQFPNARFLHITRDPYRICLSHQKSILAMPATQSFQSQVPGLGHYPISHGQRFVEFHDRYHRDQELIPEGNLFRISYEELRADTVGTLRKVYAALDLGDFAPFGRRLAAEIDARKNYHTNKYDLPAELEEQVWIQWRDYFDRYGYRRMADRK